MEPRAIQAAQRVIYSLAENGLVEPLTGLTDRMPTLELREAYRIAIEAVELGKRGFADILGHALDVLPDGLAELVRPALIDACDGLAESPGNLRKAVELLHEYHRTKRRWELSQELQAVAGDDERCAKILEELVALAAGERATAGFKWDLTNGADAWTDVPGDISQMSDAPIIEGLLRERDVATVVGAAKTSKTWFSLAMALAVADGETFVGRKTHQRKVLYLDYELKKGTFRKRLSMLAATPPSGFLYQCLRGIDQLPSQDEIAKLVRAEGFGLVVIDSLYATGWLSEECSNDSTPRELRRLQRLTEQTGCSILVVDHTAKGGGNDRSVVDASRGASSKGGFFDSLMVLRPTDKGPDPAGNYAILDAVLRDWPPFNELPLVSFTWTGATATVDLAGTVGRGEADANTTRILEELARAEKPIGLKALEEATDIPETTLRKTMKGLIRNGGLVVESVDPTHSQRKVYRLRDAMEEPRQTAPNRAA
jgi:KaiC/GvpD/RAD55 family RecA-like ATPase